MQQQGPSITISEDCFTERTSRDSTEALGPSGPAAVRLIEALSSFSLGIGSSTTPQRRRPNPKNRSAIFWAVVVTIGLGPKSRFCCKKVSQIELGRYCRSERREDPSSGIVVVRGVRTGWCCCWQQALKGRRFLHGYSSRRELTGPACDSFFGCLDQRLFRLEPT